MRVVTGSFLRLKNMAPNKDIKAFQELARKAKHVCIITGAGISAESGIPTFRGQGGFWRQFPAQELATPQAFKKNPSLVWEFYHYRRELVLTKQPNAAHKAIAEYEKRLEQEGRKVTIITTNIDDLHQKAGTKLSNLIRLHGSLFLTRCTQCLKVKENFDSPICPSLKDRGAPDVNSEDATIPVENLPRCSDCEGLLRPHVVWFNETLDPNDLRSTSKELSLCDLCLVVGTSSVVYPAASFAPQVASRGVPVAEFNLEATPVTDNFGFHFQGPCGTLLPEALSP